MADNIAPAPVSGPTTPIDGDVLVADAPGTLEAQQPSVLFSSPVEGVENDPLLAPAPLLETVPLPWVEGVENDPLQPTTTQLNVPTVSWVEGVENDPLEAELQAQARQQVLEQLNGTGDGDQPAGQGQQPPGQPQNGPQAQDGDQVQDGQQQDDQPRTYTFELEGVEQALPEGLGAARGGTLEVDGDTAPESPEDNALWVASGTDGDLLQQLLAESGDTYTLATATYEYPAGSWNFLTIPSEQALEEQDNDQNGDAQAANGDTEDGAQPLEETTAEGVTVAYFENVPEENGDAVDAEDATLDLDDRLLFQGEPSQYSFQDLLDRGNGTYFLAVDYGDEEAVTGDDDTGDQDFDDFVARITLDGITDDVLFAEEGQTTLNGLAGDDVLWAGTEQEVEERLRERDQLEDQQNPDGQQATDGQQNQQGDGAAFTLFGDAGDDELHGSDSADNLWGGTDAGQFWINADALEQSTLFAGDEIWTGDGDDTVHYTIDRNVPTQNDGVDLVYDFDPEADQVVVHGANLDDVEAIEIEGNTWLWFDLPAGEGPLMDASVGLAGVSFSEQDLTVDDVVSIA